MAARASDVTPSQSDLRTSAANTTTNHAKAARLENAPRHDITNPTRKSDIRIEPILDF